MAKNSGKEEKQKKLEKCCRHVVSEMNSHASKSWEVFRKSQRDVNRDITPLPWRCFLLSNAAAVAVIVNDRKREKLKKKYYKLDALSSVSLFVESQTGTNRELWHDSGTMSCHWPPRTPSENRQPFAPGLNKGWQNVHQPQGFEGAGFRSTELVYATGQDAKIFVSSRMSLANLSPLHILH